MLTTTHIHQSEKRHVFFDNLNGLFVRLSVKLVFSGVVRGWGRVTAFWRLTMARRQLEGY